MLVITVGRGKHDFGVYILERGALVFTVWESIYLINMLSGFDKHCIWSFGIRTAWDVMD
jgi:hypothetical protein